MRNLIKPPKLNIGDKIATISPAWGVAGEPQCLWKYNLGKERLENLGLTVIAAPNSMKGEQYLSEHPEARAEDIVWAFENADIKAIIANIGGSDSIRLIPYLNAKTIIENPKIFIGYSDIINLHLFCLEAGLSTFYGHNLLPVIAESPCFHPYSEKWFKTVLFSNSPIGTIDPSPTYSCDENNYVDPSTRKTYHEDNGYIWVQGKGLVRGCLYGGFSKMIIGTSLEPQAADFKDTILFIEDIPEFFSSRQLADFVDWLGSIGALQVLRGILIGKLCGYEPFDAHQNALLRIVNDKYGLRQLPIIANMNFGHTSPMCILPYGAVAEIDCDSKQFSILESGVM